MNIGLCDDDPEILEKLKAYVELYFKEKGLEAPTLYTYTDGSALLEDPRVMDIVFLDVEMPGLSGLAVGQGLRERNRNIILLVVTSHPCYIDDIMDLKVLRYIEKPFDQQRVFACLKKALHCYHTWVSKVTVQTKEGIEVLYTSDILYIEGTEKGTEVHTNDRTYKSAKTLSYWLDCLKGGSFFQSHRSFIINFKHVKNFDSLVVYLGDSGQRAHVTRRKYKAFKAAYMLYLEGEA